MHVLVDGTLVFGRFSILFQAYTQWKLMTCCVSLIKGVVLMMLLYEISLAVLRAT